MRFYFRKGFTLVELLVVITIFSFVGALLASTFVMGLKIWERGRAVDFVRGEAMLTLEEMSRDLRQSLNLTRVGFSGTEKEVGFPLLSGDTLVKVIYRYDTASNFLERETIPYSVFANGSLKQTGQVQHLLPAQDCAFRYLTYDPKDNEPVWSNKWDKDHGMFDAVGISLETGSGTLNRTVFLPVSSNKKGTPLL